MPKHRVLGFKPHLRLEWRGQDGQHEREQPDHLASLSDSDIPSTRIRFSVYTPQRNGADHPDTPWCTPPEPHQICADRSLVDKNEPGRIKKTLLSYPTSACSRNVLSLPFSSLQAFLRDGNGAGGWVYGLEYKAEGLGSPMQIGNHPRTVSGLVGGRARIYIVHPVLHRVVEQHCDLARRGGHCLGLADAR